MMNYWGEVGERVVLGDWIWNLACIGIGGCNQIGKRIREEFIAVRAGQKLVESMSELVKTITMLTFYVN